MWKCLKKPSWPCSVLKNELPGIYIHIPFCKTKCHYCDFVSYPIHKSAVSVELYIKTLIHEVKLRKEWLASLPSAGIPRRFQSVYVGGGTPSVVPSGLLQMLFEELWKNFDITDEAEVTIEVNPGTIERNGLTLYRQMGVNRLSIGVQSFDDSTLKKLGRCHTTADAYSVINGAKAAGFRNLSLDLMFGLPGQSCKLWFDSLSKATALSPEHISCYELGIEPNTPYGKWHSQGLLSVPTEDDVIGMMENTSTYLGSRGYQHYEISNYAKPGFQARHNSIYWKNGPYLGFGCAAYSYWQGRRFGNVNDLDLYRESVYNNRLPEADSETLDIKGSAGETIMLGLRLRDGVCLKTFEKRFGVSVWQFWDEEISLFTERGLLEVSSGCLRLTDQGLLLANQVQADFV